MIGVLFDGINDTVTFYRDGRCLGVAFRDVMKAKHTRDDEHHRLIYPMASSTSAQTEMLLCCQLRNYTSLQDRCRSVIAHSIDYSVNSIEKLPLPQMLKQFIRNEVSSKQ